MTKLRPKNQKCDRESFQSIRRPIFLIYFSTCWKILLSHVGHSWVANLPLIRKEKFNEISFVIRLKTSSVIQSGHFSNINDYLVTRQTGKAYRTDLYKDINENACLNFNSSLVTSSPMCVRIKTLRSLALKSASPSSIVLYNKTYSMDVSESVKVI